MLMILLHGYLYFLVCVKVPAHSGVNCAVMYRGFMCLAASMCSCVFAFVTVCSDLWVCMRVSVCLCSIL